MATLAQIRTQVDTFLAGLWPKIVSRQTTYAANHNGRYWQGLLSHSILPADGAKTAADALASEPTDQASSWQDAIKTDLPATWPAALVMDVYDGPLGKGFVGTVYVKVLGKVYSRSQNYGPETWRTVGWHEVTPQMSK